jgi:kynurenine formamidase
MGGAPRQPRVLLRYDWSPRFVDLDFYHRSPYLSREACHWLVDQGVKLLGMDTPSPDDPRLGQGSAEDSPNHKILLPAGVAMLEYLNNLDQLPPGEVYLVALPLNVVGSDGAPARVIAFAP